MDKVIRLEDVAERVLAYLDGASLDACRASCRTLHQLAAEPSLWRDLMRAQFQFGEPSTDMPQWQPDLSQPLAPCLTTTAAHGLAPTSAVDVAPSWREAYVRWAAVARYVCCVQGFSAPTWLGIAAAWRAVESWLAANLSAIFNTLQGPAEPGWLSTVPCFALRCAYAIHDGQNLACDEELLTTGRVPAALRSDVFKGMFGGYSAYNHVVNMRLHPIARATQITRNLSLPPGSVQVFASSFDMRRLMGATESGDVLICPIQPGLAAPPWEPAGPSFAAWFAMFAERLASGDLAVGNVLTSEDSTRGLVQFPCKVDGRTCACATTNGVEVVASSLFMPERRDQMFAYSIRLRMVSPPAQARTAQLHRRRWVINDGSGGPPHIVEGEGVIGLFPILSRGGWKHDESGVLHEGAFIYQSCTGHMGRSRPQARLAGAGAESEDETVGTFEGSLIFVPGSLDHPAGDEFEVTVPRFHLVRPTVIF